MFKNTLKLRARVVLSEDEVERVRQLRNECRAYMTRTTEPIGPAQQIAWWRSLDKNDNLLFLFDVDGFDASADISWTTVAGYGLCRRIAGQWWVSGGLTAEFQGRELGKDLFGALLRATGTPCWLEVLEHNTRAHNTYKALGFVETTREGGIVTMVKR